MAPMSWDDTTHREKSSRRLSQHGAEGRRPDMYSHFRSWPINHLAGKNLRKIQCTQTTKPSRAQKSKRPVEAAGAVKMWKTQKRFPTFFTSALENSPPQKTKARRRVSHSSHKALLLGVFSVSFKPKINQPDRSLAIKTGHFHLLPTAN
jgi:hypothetical protein